MKVGLLWAIAHMIKEDKRFKYIFQESFRILIYGGIPNPTYDSLMRKMIHWNFLSVKQVIQQRCWKYHQMSSKVNCIHHAETYGLLESLSVQWLKMYFQIHH